MSATGFEHQPDSSGNPAILDGRGAKSGARPEKASASAPGEPANDPQLAQIAEKWARLSDERRRLILTIGEF